MWSNYLQINYTNMQYSLKINMKWMKEWDKEWEVLHKSSKQSLLENLQHNSTQDDGSFGKERALSFKVIQMVEIKMNMVDNQWLNSKIGGNPCAYTSQPIEYKLTCHIRQKVS